MDSETFIYCCERCGQIFESAGFATKYCEECRPIVRREQSKVWEIRNGNGSRSRQLERYYENKRRAKAKKLPPSESIEAINRKAALCGLSYGAYVARYK